MQVCQSGGSNCEAARHDPSSRGLLSFFLSGTDTIVHSGGESRCAEAFHKRSKPHADACAVHPRGLYVRLRHPSPLIHDHHPPCLCGAARTLRLAAHEMNEKKCVSAPTDRGASCRRLNAVSTKKRHNYFFYLYPAQYLLNSDAQSTEWTILCGGSRPALPSREIWGWRTLGPWSSRSDLSPEPSPQVRHTPFRSSFSA